MKSHMTREEATKELFKLEKKLNDIFIACKEIDIKLFQKTKETLHDLRIDTRGLGI